MYELLQIKSTTVISKIFKPCDAPVSAQIGTQWKPSAFWQWRDHRKGHRIWPTGQAFYFFMSLVSCIDRHRGNAILACPLPLSQRSLRSGSGTQSSRQEVMVSLQIMECSKTLNFSSSEWDALWWPSVQASMQRGGREKTVMPTLGKENNKTNNRVYNNL